MATRILLDNLDQGLSPLASRPSLVTLGRLAAARSLEVYLVGGSVRELALGRAAQDLDLAVSAQTLELARDLAGALGGTYVLLDEAERTARVVWQGEILDLAEFRAPTLAGDLAGRDFTLNALAVDLKAVLGQGPPGLIDPWGASQTWPGAGSGWWPRKISMTTPCDSSGPTGLPPHMAFTSLRKPRLPSAGWPRNFPGWRPKGCTRSYSCSWRRRRPPRCSGRWRRWGF